MRALIEAPEFAMLTISRRYLQRPRSGCACRFRSPSMMNGNSSKHNDRLFSSRDFDEMLEICGDQHRRCSKPCRFQMLHCEHFDHLLRQRMNKRELGSALTYGA
jgi:hypothetical protein